MASSPTKSVTGGNTSSVYGMSSPSPSKIPTLQSNMKQSAPASTSDGVEETHFEDSFRGYLGSLKHTILSCTHPNFGADERSVLRAQELVKEEIRKREVEEMQNCLSLSNEVESLANEKEKLKKFYLQREIELNTTMAILERRNAELSARNQVLESQTAILDTKVTDTQRELDIRNNMDEETNEKYVKLHMDIMTHHSRVQSKVEESLRSIKAKVGFVPREVEENFQELLDIQAPGVDLAFSVPSSASSASPVRKKQRAGARR